MLNISSRYKDVDFGSSSNTEIPNITSPKTRTTNVENEVSAITMPEFLGGGQYNLDKQDPGKLIKEGRTLTEYDTDSGNKVKRSVRNGMPSFLYEVDHTIPLWAGGKDTMDNLESLQKDDHLIKTKVGAVARELYYNDKISIHEARNMAMNWRSQDEEDIKGINIDSNGRIPLDLAVEKQLQWSKPDKVSLGDWWESFKEGPKGTAGEFAQGTMSGLSMGYIPAEGHEYDNKTDQVKADIARFSGQLLGTLVNFGGLAKVVGTAGKMVLGKEALKIGKTTQEVTKLPAWLNKIRQGETIYKNGKEVVKYEKLWRALTSAGLFGLHGQLSKQEEGNFEGRIKRFLTDVSFGAMTGAATHSLKGIAGLAVGVYGLSILENPDDISGALLNTAVVAGLHGVGGIKKSGMLKSKVRNDAIETRTKLGAKKKPADFKYTEKKIVEENELLIDNVKSKFYNGEISEAEAGGLRDQVIFTGRSLYKDTLPVEQKLREDIKDVKSLFQSANKKINTNTTKVPEEINSIIGKDNNVNIENRSLQNGESENPITVILTGQGKSAIEAANIKELVKNGIKKGDTVYLYLDDAPERVRFYQQIKDDTGKIENPRNVVRAVAKNENGELVHVAYYPEKERITRPVTGINESLAEQWGLNERPGANTEIMNPEFNNSWMANYLRSTGKKVITSEIKYITDKASRSRKPAIRLEISPKDYMRSDIINGNVKKSLGAVAKKANENVIRDNQKEIAKKAVSKTKEIINEEKKLTSFDEFKVPDGETSGSFYGLMSSFSEMKQNGALEFNKFLKSLLENKGDGSYANEVNSIGKLRKFLTDHNDVENLSDKGKNVFTLTFDDNTWFSGLSLKDKAKYDNIGFIPKKVMDKTGQLKQEIKLEDIAKKTEDNKKIVEKAIKENLLQKKTENKDITNKLSTKESPIIENKAEVSSLYADVIDKVSKPGTKTTKKKAVISIDSIKSIKDRMNKAMEDGDTKLFLGYKKLLNKVYDGLEKPRNLTDDKIKASPKTSNDFYKENILRKKENVRKEADRKLNIMEEEKNGNFDFSMDELEASIRGKRYYGAREDSLIKEEVAKPKEGFSEEQKDAYKNKVEKLKDEETIDYGGNIIIDPSKNVFNNVLHKGLKAMFGEDYSSHKYLRSVLKAILTEEKIANFTKSKQPEDVIGKKAAGWKVGKRTTAKENEKLYERRKKEQEDIVDKVQERKSKQKGEDAGESVNDDRKIIDLGDGKQTTISDMLDSGMRITEETEYPIVTDLTYFDDLLNKLRAKKELSSESKTEFLGSEKETLKIAEKRRDEALELDNVEEMISTYLKYDDLVNKIKSEKFKYTEKDEAQDAANLILAIRKRYSDLSGESVTVPLAKIMKEALDK